MVFQTPPEAATTYQVLRFTGSTAISPTRPDITAGPIPRRLNPAKTACVPPGARGSAAAAFLFLPPGRPGRPRRECPRRAPDHASMRDEHRFPLESGSPGGRRPGVAHRRRDTRHKYSLGRIGMK